MRDEVYEQLSVLDKARKLGEKLIATCDGEATVRDEVTEKIAKSETGLTGLTKKVNDRQLELQAALLERQEFREAYDDLKDWLVSTDQILALQGPVSVKYNVLVDQNAKHRVSSYWLLYICFFIIWLSSFPGPYAPYLVLPHHI